jgi:hypothetical protein
MEIVRYGALLLHLPEVYNSPPHQTLLMVSEVSLSAQYSEGWRGRCEWARALAGRTPWQDPLHSRVSFGGSMSRTSGRARQTGLEESMIKGESVRPSAPHLPSKSSTHAPLRECKGRYDSVSVLQGLRSQGTTVIALVCGRLCGDSAILVCLGSIFSSNPCGRLKPYEHQCIVKTGDLTQVNKLVKKVLGVVKFSWHDGTMPLMTAAEQGQMEVVRWCLDNRAAINGQGYFERTTLWYASRHGRTPMVKLLVERSADPSIPDQTRATPLMAAICHGHLEVIHLLLDHPIVQASINVRDRSGMTALWKACYWGREGVVRALLERGADRTIPNHYGDTPMAATDLHHNGGVSLEGRREAAAALEVSLSSCPLSLSVHAYLEGAEE